MQSPEDIPVNPELAAATAAKRARPRTRTPEIPCGKPKCEFLARSRAELDEHLIEKHPTGVFGPEKQEAYLQFLLSGEGRHTAARKVGVAPATVARFTDLNPAFERALRMAEEEYVEQIEARMYEAALNAEPWAVKEVLSKRNAKRWGPVPQEININHGGEIKAIADASPQMQRVMQIMSNIEARKQLGAGPEIIDAEVIDE